MRYYDTQLKLHERLNHADIIGSLKFLVTLQPRVSKLWDYLANTNQYQTLFMECWRSHELQINNLCKAMLRKEWRVPAQEVNAIFEDRNIKIEGWKLFEAVFGTDWKKATGVSVENYSKWIEIRNQLMHSRGSASRQQLKKGISFLCQITHSLAAWGQKQKICYNGIKHLESIRIPTSKTADGNDSDRLEKDSDKILKNFPQQKLQALIKKLKKSQLCIPTP